MENNDIYDLNRFVAAQENNYGGYSSALAEIKNGRKTGHWIWYIFPQLADLGWSSTSKYYGISCIEEAVQYAKHPLLGNRLREISEALIMLETSDARSILGGTDALKVRSCMTLFNAADTEHDVYRRVLDKFYNGEHDEITLNILKGLKANK